MGYSLFGVNGAQIGDIKQGSIGNCWIMSAIAAVAEFPGRVEALFKSDAYQNNSGFFDV